MFWMQPFTLALIVLGAYLLVMAGVSLWLRGRGEQGSVKGFFLAGKHLGPWWVGASFAAAWFGATSTKGSLDAYYSEGLAGAWKIAIPSVLSLLLLATVLAKRVCRQPYDSLPQAVEAHYGSFGRLMLSNVLVIQALATLAAQLVAVYGVLHFFLPEAAPWLTVSVAYGVALYCLLGGFFTVALTDIIQLALLLGSLGAVLGWLLWQGWQHPQALQHFWQGQGEGYFSLGVHWKSHVLETCTMALAWGLAPEMWQRMKAASSEGVARRGAWLAFALVVLLYSAVLLLGLLAGGVLGTPQAGQPPEVLSRLAAALPHPALGALLFVAFLTAVTSTLDSVLNCVAYTCTYDVAQRFVWKDATQAQLVSLGRWLTLLLPVPPLLIALQAPSIFSVIWFSADVYASVAVVPLLMALLLKVPHRRAGQVAFGIGGLCAVLVGLENYTPFAIPYWPSGFWGPLSAMGLSAAGYLWVRGRCPAL